MFHSDTPRQVRASRELVAVIVVAAIIRGGLLLAMPHGLSVDTDGYRSLAENLVQYGVYGFSPSDDGAPPVPTAYRPPLYPLLLSTVALSGNLAPVGIGLLHLLLGVLTVAVVYLIALRCRLKEFRWLACLLVACDPILLNQSAQIMTETLAALLAAVALWMLIRLGGHPRPRTAAAVGVALALAILCRPVFLVWWIACGCTVLWICRRNPSRLQISSALLIGTLLVLTPWAIRNHHLFGRPKITTTHGGYTLLLANNPAIYRHLRDRPWGSPWDASEWTGAHAYLAADSPQAIVSPHEELRLDRQAYQLAFNCIREEPRMFAWSCVSRVARLWGCVPRRVDARESSARTWLRYGAGVWNLAVLLLVAGGAAGLRRDLLRTPWLWGVLLCLALTVVHLFFWTNLRMRAPLVPFFALLAARGGASAWAGLRRRVGG